MIYCSANFGTINPARKTAGMIQANIPALLQPWSGTAQGHGLGRDHVVDFILGERSANGPPWSLGAHVSFPSAVCEQDVPCDEIPSWSSAGYYCWVSS